MEYKIDRSKQFKKEYNKLKTSGNKSLLRKTDEVIENLKNKNFTPSMQNHQLKGNMKGWWDAHISGDYVIIYKYDESSRILILDKLGTHETTNIESVDDLTSEEFDLMQNLY